IAVECQPSVKEGKAYQLCRCGLYPQQRFADDELADAWYLVAGKQARQRLAAGDDPLDLARVESGRLGVEREHVDGCAAGRVGDRDAFEVFGLFQSRILTAVDPLRWLGIDDRSKLHRNLVVASRQHQRASVSKAERRVVRAGLADGVDRALAPQN